MNEPTGSNPDEERTGEVPAQPTSQIPAQPGFGTTHGQAGPDSFTGWLPPGLPDQGLPHQGFSPPSSADPGLAEPAGHDAAVPPSPRDRFRFPPAGSGPTRAGSLWFATPLCVRPRLWIPPSLRWRPGPMGTATLGPQRHTRGLVTRASQGRRAPRPHDLCHDPRSSRLGGLRRRDDRARRLAHHLGLHAQPLQHHAFGFRRVRQPLRVGEPRAGSGFFCIR